MDNPKHSSPDPLTETAELLELIDQFREDEPENYERFVEDCARRGITIKDF